MITQRTIRRTLLALALAALGANGTALATPWFGDTLETAEPFPDDNGVTAQVLMGNINNNDLVDFDYYFFQANAGQSISLNIAVFAGNELDPILTVFGPNDTVRHQFKNNGQFPVTETGVWKVSVASDLTGPAGFAGGFYDLTLTRSTDILAIDIDIKPSNPHNATPIKMGERHIRVALLAKQGFDPFAIDVKSLKFGPTGTESSYVRCATRGKDRNGDRKPDRVCRFDIGKTGFTLANTAGWVKGKTRDGKAFQGKADVKVLAKHQGHHNDRNRHDDDDDD
jgi:hypothetical protein